MSHMCKESVEAAHSNCFPLIGILWRLLILYKGSEGKYSSFRNSAVHLWRINAAIFRRFSRFYFTLKVSSFYNMSGFKLMPPTNRRYSILWLYSMSYKNSRYYFMNACHKNVCVCIYKWNKILSGRVLWSLWEVINTCKFYTDTLHSLHALKV